MKEQLIDFQTAKLAKEKGFKEGSMSHYEEDGQIQHCRTSFANGFMEDGETRFEAPTQSLLQKWLREVHDINISILMSGFDFHQYILHNKNRRYVKTVDNPITPENYKNNWEDTLEKGLQEALELI